jgi:hypothetical protein
VSAFDIAAVLIAVAAVSGYVNHRLLHLSPTSGTLLVALVREGYLAGEHVRRRVFSVLVQGLTVRRVLVYYGVGEPEMQVS